MHQTEPLFRSNIHKCISRRWGADNPPNEVSSTLSGSQCDVAEGG